VGIPQSLILGEGLYRMKARYASILLLVSVSILGMLMLRFAGDFAGAILSHDITPGADTYLPLIIREVTPAPVCTLPTCQRCEAHYCTDFCPGGCGVICATVTPIGGPYPPGVVCTPPACQPGEEYYCPCTCPGGCGTVCATPTPR
jgi:hypothetical protein